MQIRRRVDPGFHGRDNFASKRFAFDIKGDDIVTLKSGDVELPVGAERKTIRVD